MVNAINTKSLVSAAELPLHGTRILTTAPRQYASKLSNYLVNAGARPIWIPAIEVSQLPEDEINTLDDTLASLSNFSHVAFTSKNGIHAMMNRLNFMQGGWEDAAYFLKCCNVKLCALGADCKVLEEYGLHTDIQPEEASTQGLVKELVGRKEAAGARILCPVPSVRGGLVEPAVVPRFLAALEASGATTCRLDAYVTKIGSTPELCVPEKHLLASGQIDAIIFSSTAEAQGLVHLMESKEIIKRAVQEHGVVLSAHGPYTAKGAGEVLDMNISCISKDFATFHGVVAALEDCFRKRSLSKE